MSSYVGKCPYCENKVDLDLNTTKSEFTLGGVLPIRYTVCSSPFILNCPHCEKILGITNVVKVEISGSLLTVMKK